MRPGLDVPHDRQILAPALFLALILTLIAVIPTVLSSRLIAIGDQIADDTSPLATTGNEIVRLLSDQQAAVGGYVAGGDERFLAPYTAAGAELPAAWLRADQQAGRVGGAAPALVLALRGAADDWRTQAAEAEIQLVQSGRRGEAVAMELDTSSRQLFVRFREHADALIEYVDQVGGQLRAERLAVARTQIYVFVGLALLGMCGLALIFQLATRTQRYLSEASNSDAMIQAKDEFLAIAAHELRTPLTSIKGHAQMLLRQGRAGRTGTDADWERALKHAATIDRQSARLTRLIEQLLEVTGAESKLIELRHESADLVAMAEHVVEQFRPVAPLHPIAIAAAEAPILAQVDRHRVEQVLFNLIDNAVKYSPEGGPIEICLSVRGAEAVVTVRDRGVGVPLEEQERVMDRFYRASNVVGTSISGMGVGLYIARAIVQRHNGQIWLESVPNRGSTFGFSIPIALPA